MRLSPSRVSRFVFGLTFLFSAAPAFSQFEEMADITADSVATSRLVAKSPTLKANITDRELAERLGQMSGCLDLRPTRVVKSYVTHYLLRTEKTRKILKNRLTYFPIFERELREQGLPDDLKYLAVVESALNASALSRVGASGLWQFMPYTGTDYGMQINSAVDERNNIVKSTEGAARYLKHLYAQYNDWALVLAAYNSGPNRVNAAMRRAGSKNFWVIQRYLPEETRNYVPAFIAASYICTFFNEHNMEFEQPDLDHQLIDHITVYDGLSFSAIAKATGLPYSMVSELNPGFKRAYVPPSKRGYYVSLPKRVMPAFVRHLNGLGANQYKLDANDYTPPADHVPGGTQYYYTTIKCSEADLLDQFAAKAGCNGAQLRAWNNLPNHYVYPDQTLKVWHPVPAIKHIGAIESPVAANNKKTEAATAPTSRLIVTTVSGGAAPAPTGAKPATKPAGPQKQYQFHKVKDKETMGDLSRRYGVSEDALMNLNNTSDLKPGMLVKIKEIK